MKKPKVVNNIVVGEPATTPTAPGHVAGVAEGNHPHATERGNDADSARRSTGVNSKGHEPIDPKMPKLSPA